MRIIIDMNLTPRWVEHLINAGHEARRWSPLGSATAKDRRSAIYARSAGCAVLTNDLDFPEHTMGAGPSVILLRGEPFVPEYRGPALIQALAKFEKELAQGAVVSIDWPVQPRARVLPLR
jgi:predicted nuclease of predicted toxin-antitoxin system